MPVCPQCSKQLREITRRCPSCQADLDLLHDYVRHLDGSADKAKRLTEAGELGNAVWAYLEILEVDPDHAAARKQVSSVVTAVRQFDASTPQRRWASGAPSPNDGKDWTRWLLILSAVLLAFVIGVFVGRMDVSSTSSGDGSSETKKDQPPRPHNEPPPLGRN